MMDLKSVAKVIGRAPKSRRYSLGWKPDKPDHRDKVVRFDAARLQNLPATNSRFSSILPPIFDQLDLGACTANAIIRAFLAACAAEAAAGNSAEANVPMLSRLMLYYNERVIEGDVDQDAGAEIRDGIKAIASQGVCPESEWPYDPTQFATAPSAQAVADAKSHIAIKYLSIPVAVAQLQAAMFASKLPIAFGFPCYESIDSEYCAQTGIIPFPHRGEAQVGGHAIVFNGAWDNHRQLMGIDNSWGTSWGESGSGWLPYAYILRGMVSDCWQIQGTKDTSLPSPITVPAHAMLSLATAL